MALCTAKMNALFSQQQKFGQTCEQINKTKKTLPFVLLETSCVNNMCHNQCLFYDDVFRLKGGWVGIPPFFRAALLGKICHVDLGAFSTFSGIIFTVGTRCRLRFAATFLSWTYCISQGMVRVCPFANFLLVPGWNLNQVQSNNFGQMRNVLLMYGRWPIFARQLALYWPFII